MLAVVNARPTVSILLPAYRAETTIARAVASLLAQDFEDWELVIACDDGVDYLAVLAAAGIGDRRLRQVPTDRRGSGCVAARNAALAAARGRLVTPLDGDDLFAPGRLAILVPLAERLGAVIDNVVAVEDSSLKILSHFIAPEAAPAMLDSTGFLATWVPAKPLVAAEIGLAWDPDSGLSDDVVYVLQLFDRLGPLPFVTQPLQEYRVIDGSLCHRGDSVAAAEAGYCRLLERLDKDTLMLRSPGMREAIRCGIQAKRRLNRAYGSAATAGFVGTFQHFAALEGRGFLAAATDCAVH